MQDWVTNDAAYTDIFPGDFELGFDQGDKMRARSGKRHWHRQYRRQSGETGIADNDIDGIRNPVPGQLARIGPVENYHPVIAPQLPVNLPVSHIDREHPCRTSGQQDIGKSACGSADIQSHGTQYIDTEMIQRMIQL